MTRLAVDAALLKVGSDAHGPAVDVFQALGYALRSIVFGKDLD